MDKTEKELKIKKAKTTISEKILDIKGLDFEEESSVLYSPKNLINLFGENRVKNLINFFTKEYSFGEALNLKNMYLILLEIDAITENLEFLFEHKVQLTSSDIQRISDRIFIVKEIKKVGVSEEDKSITIVKITFSDNTSTLFYF